MELLAGTSDFDVVRWWRNGALLPQRICSPAAWYVSYSHEALRGKHKNHFYRAPKALDSQLIRDMSSSKDSIYISGCGLGLIDCGN